MGCGANGIDRARGSCTTSDDFQRFMKASVLTSRTITQQRVSTARDPSVKQPLLDRAEFEAFAKAAKRVVSEGLPLRALMAQAPPSKANTKSH